MAHFMGMTYVSADKVFAIDEIGGTFWYPPSPKGSFLESVPINARSAPVSVGRLTEPDCRVYVGTHDGNVALFDHGDITKPPQLFHVTDQPIEWSLYHAAGVIYVGTGDFTTPAPFSLIALDDQTFVPRWQVSSPGPVLNPVGVAYEGKVPKQVIFSSENPSPSVRALDIVTGTELWSDPVEAVWGQKVHDGVVYYDGGNGDLRARSASDGKLLWSFTGPDGDGFTPPAAAGGVVWVGSGHQVFALRASDGGMLWETQIDAFPTTPVVHFDHFAGLSLLAFAEENESEPCYLQALDANTGAVLWTSSAPVSQPGDSCTDPIVIPSSSGDLVQVGTVDGTLMTFAASNGQLVWQQQFSPDSPLYAKPHWVYQ